MNETEFADAFEKLTGNPPFPWQWKLYEHFAAGEIPSSCTLPTGLGKTLVIAIWLLALASGGACPRRLPRRLVYVVNRRTVVDQSTREAEKLRANLTAAGLTERLKALCAVPADPPLAISTLRGQFADNREWSRDPARPALIVGTVDMIGSRLLFGGYGCGFKTRPLHAGFLGQDALLVHDEAHLEPAFQKLIEAIECEQERCREFSRLRVMALTATPRGGGDMFPDDEERRANEQHPVVQKRVRAKKAVHLHENEDERRLADAIAELALKHKDSGCAVLVFARTVEAVEKIADKLRKARQQVETLTGTLRGLERDRLATGNSVFARFLPPSDRKVESKEGTVYLVCTSAGEVGVNLSADHLVCDLSTFESMAQRFGRVNRFGDRDDTRIDVVYPEGLPSEDAVAAEKQKEKARQDEMVFVDGARRRTLDLLRSLDGDGSPAALGRLDPAARQAAFTPPPAVLPTSDVLFDAWALTTVRDRLPGRPPVEPYLHGVRGWEPPETHVAWREEVGLVTEDLLRQNDPEDLLDDYPLKPHELLRDNSSRVFDRLKKLTAPADTPVWVVADDGTVEVTTLGGLIEAGREGIERQTLLLPPSAGGLEGGMFTGTSKAADDVADELYEEDGRRRRVRVWSDDPEIESKTDGLRPVRRIDFPPTGEDEDEGGRSWQWFERPRDGDSDGSKAGRKPVLWQVHTNDVTGNVTVFVERLPLTDELKRALVHAAEWHDLGKRRPLFQRILGNTNPNVLLAKSGKRQQSVGVREDYRHEFGSLVDLLAGGEPGLAGYRALDDDAKDLVLHLIAVHHGYGRPHFPAEMVFDPDPRGQDLTEIAAQVVRRYARLQRKYGRWGLAYLESLLRAADYAASAEPSAFVEDDA